jgi:hypothetical protein
MDRSRPQLTSCRPSTAADQPPHQHPQPPLIQLIQPMGPQIQTLSPYTGPHIGPKWHPRYPQNGSRWPDGGVEDPRRDNPKMHKMHKMTKMSYFAVFEVIFGPHFGPPNLDPQSGPPNLDPLDDPPEHPQMDPKSGLFGPDIQPCRWWQAMICTCIISGIPSTVAI